MNILQSNMIIYSYMERLIITKIFIELFTLYMFGDK